MPGPAVIMGWGDSLTDGKGQTPFLSFLAQLQPVQGDNRGVPAETSTQILARMATAPDTWALPSILWCGRNDLDIHNTPAQDVAGAVTTIDNLAAMVALLGHAKFLVLGVTPTSLEPAGSFKHSVRLRLNGILALTYGRHFLDVARLVTDQADRSLPGDVLAERAGTLPPSLLIDTLHFNAEGYALIAALIAERMALLLDDPGPSPVAARRAAVRAYFNL